VGVALGVDVEAHHQAFVIQDGGGGLSGTGVVEDGEMSLNLEPAVTVAGGVDKESADAAGVVDAGRLRAAGGAGMASAGLRMMKRRLRLRFLRPRCIANLKMAKAWLHRELTQNSA
jgi:hypothetical protein